MIRENIWPNLTSLVSIESGLSPLSIDTRLVKFGQIFSRVMGRKLFDLKWSDMVWEQHIRLYSKLVPQFTPKEIKKTDSGLVLVGTNGTSIETDCVLMAIGRHALLKPLTLEKVGVEVNDRGYIQVDKFQNTNVPGVPDWMISYRSNAFGTDLRIAWTWDRSQVQLEMSN